METSEAVQARLAQMVADDPSGTEAKRLLSCLTIFHGTFDWEAVMGVLIPREKDQMLLQLLGQDASADVYVPHEDDRRLLDVLMRWEWLTQHPLQRVSLSTDTLYIVFPPASDLHRRHLEYYVRLHGNHTYNLFKKSRDWLITDDWANISAALQWGFQKSSYDAIEFLAKLSPYIRRHIPFEARITLWQQAYEAAHHVHLGHSPARCYEVVGDLASQDDLDDIVYESYRQAIDINKTLRWNEGESRLLSKLKVYAQQHGHLARALAFLERLKLMVDRSQRIWEMVAVLRDLGELHGQLKEPVTARDYFALSLSMPQTVESSIHTLWAWGRMEHQWGDAQAGCSFCRLAILSIQAQVEHHESGERRTRFNLPSASETMERMKTESWQAWLDRCERDFAAMTGETP